ncbi:MAG: PEP-CTERM sorting domain-containing protein [Blastochloris sp.]|nr:PEP-CTERM sorting domain-containing protein [Blastochloris sp.]
MVDYSSTTFLLTDLSYTTSVVGLTGNFLLSGTRLSFDVIAVPEPSTYALLSVAAVAFTIFFRRRAVKV